MKLNSITLIASFILCIVPTACVGMDPSSEEEGDISSDVADSDVADSDVAENEVANSIADDGSSSAASDYAYTCTSWSQEYPARCFGKCEAYPNTLRWVGSEPDIQYGHCQAAVNQWCQARNFGYATFACWGHL